MLGFAAASSPVLVLAAMVGGRAVRSAPVALRRAIAGGLLLGALIMLLRPLGQHHEANCHDDVVAGLDV